MSGKIQYINPEGLLKNPAFSQVVTTQGSGKTIYIGGQDALNLQEEIVGKGNIAEQTEQAMRNLQTALSACGATFDNLVKLTIYLVQGQDLYSGFEASRKFFAGLANPPVISVLIVAGLAHPDFLVEIDAMDEQGDRNLVAQYNVESYPTKILIDPNGKLIRYFKGETNELYEKLDSLLEDR